MDKVMQQFKKKLYVYNLFNCCTQLIKHLLLKVHSLSW